jgi:hypothetical protein
LRNFVDQWVEWFPGSYREINRPGEEYLIRVYLMPRVWPFTKDERWSLLLHYFVNGDADEALHNHPWEWALSLILLGGYSEERLSRGSIGENVVTRKTARAGSLNFIRANDFHRVDLLDEKLGCWTLFLTGPRTQSWGFWDRVTQQFTHWKSWRPMHESSPHESSLGRFIRGEPPKTNMVK